MSKAHHGVFAGSMNMHIKKLMCKNNVFCLFYDKIGLNFHV